MRRLAIVPFSLVLALAAPAAAQTDPQQDSQSPQADKCRAPEQGNKQQPAGGDLTETLSDCGGVLKPPATGDQGMTAPAPDQGKTPVIKPGEVPAQPPAQ
ncbi:hypothetical protein [Mesorhizobium qingshengii]|uniref:Uncharacterized protein n=1 Tax=Mesorhizobium qingshengii TaxID=1165689 RepID=A0A1G5Z3F9_9HYPH|nr:hypothetical protein [Mesorhizobium qingshengii]SDA89060.1 hypothetical protein SAMN02927914_04112 [Mesorhizobium qingshengii]